MPTSLRSEKSQLTPPVTRKPIAYDILPESYFNRENPTREYKINLVENNAKNITKPEVYGDFTNNETFEFYSIQMLMDSCYEKEHREEIVHKESLDHFTHPPKCLDIGVGAGYMTESIAKKCSKVTVVDTSQELLNNIPDYYISQDNSTNTPVTKIHNNILDITLPEECFDFITMLHTIYFVPKQLRMELLNELRDSLCEGGQILIAYNGGLGRSSLVNNFNGTTDDLGGFLMDVLSNPEYKAHSLASMELMQSNSTDPMLYIAGVMLSDAGVTATESSLHSYIEHSVCYNGHCQLEMYQNFLFVGA